VNQAYTDIRRNKQLDQHEDFKRELVKQEMEIKQMTGKYDTAEFDVAKYMNVLKRTEIEASSIGEKLKELSKMISTVESKTNKVHIIWKSISSAEILMEEELMKEKIAKQRLKNKETIQELVKY
jgi:hypothetical protein